MSNNPLHIYDEFVTSCSIFPDGEMAYPVLGLCGESGEVAEQVKKIIRDDGGQATPERLEAIKKELGDVLWYVTAVAHEFGYTIEDIMNANMAKLTKRKDEGKLHGEGSER